MDLSKDNPRSGSPNESATSPTYIADEKAIGEQSIPNHRNSEEYNEKAAETEGEHQEKQAQSPTRQLPDDVEKGGKPTDTTSISEEQDDTFVVFWNGPDDPANPRNWPGKAKWGNVLVISFITLVTPLASSMFAPGVPFVMNEFRSTSITLASFVVSVYLLGYAFGPLLMAPLSEYYGRLYVYHGSNIIFIVFTIACAVSQNLDSLIVFRFFAGCFGSTPLVLGSGTIGDMFPQEERGKVMALWGIGPLIGPVVGPIAGGFLSEGAGWRWVFWLIAIATGVVTIGGVFVMRETYPPIILQRRAKQLRKKTGNDKYRSKLQTADSPKTLFLRAIVRPMKMLFRSPIVFVLTLFMSVVYGYLYLLFTTITEVFEDVYHWSAGVVGLAFLGIGIGMLVGLGIFGAVSDAALKKRAAGGKPMMPEWRLPPMLPGAMMIPIGFFWYGWSAEKAIHWIMPIIGTAFVGLGLIGTFMPIQTYLVDAFTLYAASAVAANMVARSAVGAILPLAGRPLYEDLGLGWGNSLLGFIALAMVPIPLVFMRYGEFLRTSPRFRVEF